MEVFPPGFPGRHVALFGGVEDAADFGEGNFSSGDCAGNGPHDAAHAKAFIAHPAGCKYIPQAPRSRVGSKSPQEEPVRTFRDRAKLEEAGENLPPHSPGHEDEIEGQQEKSDPENDEGGYLFQPPFDGPAEEQDENGCRKADISPCQHCSFICASGEFPGDSREDRRCRSGRPSRPADLQKLLRCNKPSPKTLGPGWSS